MKKIFFILFLTMWMAVAGFATDITVQSTTVPNWVGPTSRVELWLFLTQTMTTPDGQTYPGSTPKQGVAVMKVACTVVPSFLNGVNSYTLQIPQITLPATTNAVVGAQSQYVAYFYQVTGTKGTQISAFPGFEVFRLYSSPSVQTWSAIRIANNPAAPLLADNSTLSTSQIMALLGSGSGSSTLPSCTPAQMLYYAVSGTAPACLNLGTGFAIGGGSLSYTAPANIPRKSGSFVPGNVVITNSSGELVDSGSPLTPPLAGVPTRLSNLEENYYANGDDTQTTGTINASGTALVVTDLLNFKPSQWVAVTGVGVGGEPLVAQITAINSGSKTLTLSVAATSSGAGVNVRADNFYPLQNAINNANTSMYAPHGYFWIYNPPGRTIMLRAATEGNPIILEGSGDNSTQFKFWGTGDGLRAPTDQDVENIVIRDLTLYNTNASTRGWALNLSTAQVVNYPRIERVRIYGWWGGIYCSNCQGGQFNQIVARLNKHSHLILAGGESLWIEGQEPNVNTIEESQFDLMPKIAGSDVALSGLSIAGGSHVLTSGSAVFTSDHVGRVVRVVGAGTTGGDLFGLIISVESATQATISAKNGKGTLTSGLTGTIMKPNFNNLYFLRANGTTFASNIVQGNNYGDGGGSTQDISALYVEKSDAFRVEQGWFENSGGGGGAAITLKDTMNAVLDGFKTNSQGSCDGTSHCWDLRGINAKGTQVLRARGSLSILHYNLDANSDVTVDYSQLGNPDFYNEDGPQRVTYGDNVTFASWGDVQRGTETMYDATYGENRITSNTRFDNGLTGWTATVPAGVTARTDGDGRYRTYARVNTTGPSAAAITTIFQRTITIPDSEMSSDYVFAMDYRVVSATGASGDTNSFDISIEPSAGGTGYNHPTGARWQVRADNATGYPIGRWLRAQYRLKTAAGTNRSFVIKFRASAALTAPVVDVTNVRLQPGRHASWSNEQPITDLAGGTISGDVFFPAYAGGGTQSAAFDNNGKLVVGGGGGGPVSWGGILGTLSSQTDLNTALGLKAPLASPALTGTPTAPTASPGTDTTQVATTAFVTAAVAAGGGGGGSTSSGEVVPTGLTIGGSASGGQKITNCSAIQTAVSAGGTVLMPAGKVQLDIACTLNVTGTVVLKGSDPDSSEIEVTGAPTVADTKFLNYTGGDLTLRNIKFTGTADATNPTIGSSFVKRTTGSYTLRLDRVKVSGFAHGISLSSGGSSDVRRIYIENSDIAVSYQAVSAFANNGADVEMHIKNSNLTNTSTITSYPGDPAFNNHLTYFHPNVSWEFEDVVLTSSAGLGGAWALHNYGSQTTPVPKFNRMQNVTVNSTQNGFIVTGGSVVRPLELDNVTMNITGTCLDSITNTRVSNSKFYPSTASWCLSANSGSGQKWDIDNVLVQYTGVAGGVAVNLTAGNPSMNTSVNNLRCVNARDGCLVIGGTGSTARVVNVSVENSLAGGQPAIILGSAGNPINDAFLSNIVVRTGHSYALQVGGVTNEATITNSRFESKVGFIASAMWAKVRIDNSTFTHASPFDITAPFYSNIQLRPGQGANLDATALSGGNATLDAFSNFYRVTSASTINNINIVNSAYNPAYHLATVTLHFDSAATTSAAGNLVPKTTSARTVGTQATFRFDGTGSGKWVEQ